MPVLLVMLGGALGAACRYGFALGAGRWPGFPWATFGVNLIGGLLAGVALAWLGHRSGAVPEALRLFLGVGFLGGFTTFSAFSVETMTMIQSGRIGLAATYALLSCAGAVAMVFAGLWIGKAAA